MTSREIYKKFILKLNENDRNSNIKIGKGEFILMFNEQVLFWLREAIKNKKNSSEKNELYNLLIVDKELILEDIGDKFDKYKIPFDFFDIESSYTIAKKEGCVRKLYNNDFKQRNRSIVEQDSNNNPSFDFEETIINLSEKNLIVFKEGFEIDNVFMSYYKKPILLDIEGYEKIDGTLSKDIETDLSDLQINTIINRTILEVTSNYKDTESVQLSNTKIKI